MEYILYFVAVALVVLWVVIPRKHKTKSGEATEGIGGMYNQMFKKLNNQK